MSADRVDVRYVLDEAEIPTFQQRDTPDATILARKQAEVRRGLVLTVDGRRVALRPAGRATIAHPAGQGGLRTTRVELPLTAPAKNARRVELRDDTFGDRVGWKAIVAAPGQGTAVRSSVAAKDPTNGLRTYPSEVLDSPADVREARLDVEPGAGTLTAPDGERTFAGQDTNRAEREFTDVFSDASAGEGVLLLLLLAAFGWGAVHALSPGHGKAMVAAYLVGTRGQAAARGRARADRHGHAHDRGLRARRDHARALAVRAARDALPVAEPRVRPARRARRRGRAARAPAARARQAGHHPPHDHHR